MKIVLTSFTPATASGGVPRWNRDFMAGFKEGEVVHYSWTDFLKSSGMRDMPLPESDRAILLTQWLVWGKKLQKDDVLIGDGFWACTDGQHPYNRTVQVSHGNWSHTTKTDVEKGIQSEFPIEHEAQLRFRRKMAEKGGHLVAVSDFISHQCDIQWGLKHTVINNGVDLNKFMPPIFRIPRKRPVVIHGVTNGNKGTDHIALLERKLDADVILLDDAAMFFNSIQSERKLTKYQALTQADVVAIPSAHEGNSYFCLEALASNVPVMAYSVGLPYKFFSNCGWEPPYKTAKTEMGLIIDRDDRSPENFLSCMRTFLRETELEKTYWLRPRKISQEFSLENFQRGWHDYLKMELGYGS